MRIKIQLIAGLYPQCDGFGLAIQGKDPESVIDAHNIFGKRVALNLANTNNPTAEKVIGQAKAAARALLRLE